MVTYHGNASQRLMLANSAQTHLAGNFKITRSGFETRTSSSRTCSIIQTLMVILITLLTLILTRQETEDGMNLCPEISRGDMQWVLQCYIWSSFVKNKNFRAKYLRQTQRQKARCIALSFWVQIKPQSQSQLGMWSTILCTSQSEMSTTWLGEPIEMLLCRLLFLPFPKVR